MQKKSQKNLFSASKSPNPRTHQLFRILQAAKGIVGGRGNDGEVEKINLKIIKMMGKGDSGLRISHLTTWGRCDNVMENVYGIFMDSTCNP